MEDKLSELRRSSEDRLGKLRLEFTQKESSEIERQRINFDKFDN